MIFRINVPRILNRLRQKGGDIPKWPRVKRLESVESEGNVWGRTGGHEPSCPKTHAEATNTQREAFVILQPRNHINNPIDLQFAFVDVVPWLKDDERLT